MFEEFEISKKYFLKFKMSEIAKIPPSWNSVCLGKPCEETIVLDPRKSQNYKNVNNPKKSFYVL